MHIFIIALAGLLKSILPTVAFTDAQTACKAATAQNEDVQASTVFITDMDLSNGTSRKLNCIQTATPDVFEVLGQGDIGSKGEVWTQY